MARLLVDSGPDEGMVFPLSEGVTTIGRGSSNHVPMADRRASRFHAEIVRRNFVYRLRDTGSRNGTSLNGVRISDECTLRHGDQVRIGQTLFVFEDEEQQAADSGIKDRRTASSAVCLADESPTLTCGSVPAGGNRAFETVVDRERGREGSESRQRLEILLRLLAKVRPILELDRLLREIMELIFEFFQPERGLILLYDSKKGVFVPRMVKAADGAGEIMLSRTIMHQAIRERVALLISDVEADSRFQRAESVVVQHIRSAMCAPLIAQEQVLGVIYMDSRSRKTDYSQADLELLTGITDQAALAISNAILHQSQIEQNRLERELEIARTIQMNLLPKKPPAVAGFGIAAMSVPAKSVGGDYYDFMEIDADRLGVAVADVSGKGVPAAILTASVRAALQVQTRQGEDHLGTIVSDLNEMACRDAANDMFVALFFGILQISTRQFRYINAGHSCPLLFDAQGKETRLDQGGCVLGILPNRRFEQGEVRLDAGSTLVIYSDGVTDEFNEQNEAFGLDRLREIIAANREESPETLREKIVAATTAYRRDADLFDDYTLVIIKAL